MDKERALPLLVAFILEMGKIARRTSSASSDEVMVIEEQVKKELLG